jgi:hypothetical protein
MFPTVYLADRIFVSMSLAVLQFASAIWNKREPPPTELEGGLFDEGKQLL